MTLEELETKHAAMLTECFDFSPPDGWLSLVDELLTKLTAIGEAESVQIQVHQLKEKVAGMRCYLGPAPREAHDLVHEYERRSQSTCEACGNAGRGRSRNGYYRTLCQEHYWAWLGQKR